MLKTFLQVAGSGGEEKYLAGSIWVVCVLSMRGENMHISFDELCSLHKRTFLTDYRCSDWEQSFCKNENLRYKRV